MSNGLPGEASLSEQFSMVVIMQYDSDHSLDRHASAAFDRRRGVPYQKFYVV